MAEQTFRSPGFFEKEIDLSARQATPLGIPAGIIGTSVMGPAFVPVTVGSLADFETRFGSLDSDRFGPYAVREFLKNRTAVTYIRTLGAGANETTTDIENTRLKGTVKNAGFSLEGTAMTARGSTWTKHKGCVQFLVASHSITENESRGFPVFSDNESFRHRDELGTAGVNVVRGVLFTTTGSRFTVMDWDQTWETAHDEAGGGIKEEDDVASLGDLGLGGSTAAKHFKLVLSSTSGAEFANDESAGLRIYTASLDPNNQQYIGKILNTDPHKFQSEEHLLYLDFAVESEVASVVDDH